MVFQVESVNLKKLINDGEISLVMKKVGPKDSVCWNSFAKLMSKKQFLNVVQCKKCKIFYRYHAKNGSSTLNKHHLECSGQPAITSMAISTKKLLKEDKELLKTAQANFSIMSLSPFAIHENPGLYKLADEFIRIGAKYGRIKSEEILFSRNTIASHCQDLGRECTEKLMNKITNVIANGNFCLMADIWTSKYKRDSFLGIHVQYLNENFQLRNQVLEMYVFPERHTGENIKTLIDKATEKFPEDIEIRIVTDCAANMKAGTRHLTRFNCICHRLSTVIEHSWKESLQQIEEIRLIDEKINSLVTTLNHRSDIQNQLLIKIKDSSQTRAWRGLYEKYRRVHVNFQKVLELSLNDKSLRTIASIDEELLGKITCFLKPIIECFNTFEQESNPSSNMVLVKYHQLKQHFQNNVFMTRGKVF